LLNESNIQTYRSLGLTINQAKVYLAMQCREFSTVYEIRMVSEVPRQEIYKILSTLEEMGMVEKTLKRPIRFRALKMQEAVSFLLKNKTQELKEIKKNIKEMLKNFKPTIHDKNNNEVKPTFLLISKKEASISKVQKEIDKAKTCIDFIVSWKVFHRSIDAFRNNTKKALKRNVKIRMVLEKPKNMHEFSEELQVFKQFPQYQLRFILNSPQALMGIYDKKQMMIQTSSTVDLAEKPFFWTDNPCLLSALIDYFDLVWLTALEKDDAEQIM